MLPEDLAVHRLGAGEHHPFEAAVPRDLEHVEGSVHADLDAQGRVRLRGNGHQRRQMGHVGDAVVDDDLVQALGIQDVPDHQVHVLLDVRDQRGVHPVVHQHRPHTVPDQVPGGDRAVHAHAARNQNLHVSPPSLLAKYSPRGR